MSFNCALPFLSYFFHKVNLRRWTISCTNASLSFFLKSLILAGPAVKLSISVLYRLNIHIIAYAQVRQEVASIKLINRLPFLIRIGNY